RPCCVAAFVAARQVLHRHAAVRLDVLFVDCVVVYKHDGAPAPCASARSEGQRGRIELLRHRVHRLVSLGLEPTEALQFIERTSENVGPIFPHTRHRSDACRLHLSLVPIIVRCRSTSLPVSLAFVAVQSRPVGRSSSNSAITAECSGIVDPCGAFSRAPGATCRGTSHESGAYDCPGLTRTRALLP